MDDVNYVSQLRDIALDIYGENYMVILAEKSGFSRNNIERIFGNKYKLKLKDFITLCDSLDLELELKNNQQKKEYPKIKDVILRTGDDKVEYKKE